MWPPRYIGISTALAACGRTYGLEGAEIQDKPKPAICFHAAF
eukprot:COSAG02_NODE_26109_length_640_cov_2.698706_1_plen_41_part_01